MTTLARLALNVSSTRLILLDGRRRQGHRDLWQLRDRQLGHRRPGRVPDPDRHPVRRDHERRDPGRRGRSALHPRRDARQADGHRRRPRRRPHRRAARPRRPAAASPRRRTSTGRWTVRRSSSRATPSPRSSSLRSTSSAGSSSGMGSLGMSFSDAVNTFSLLSVGDGLVSQIPALMISISTGLLVTRVGSDENMGAELGTQLSAAPGPSGFASLADRRHSGCSPASPSSRFSDSPRSCSSASVRSADIRDDAAGEASDEPVSARRTQTSRRPWWGRCGSSRSSSTWPTTSSTSSIPAKSGDLLDRVRSLRRQIAMELGVVMPFVRTRDDVSLPPGHLQHRAARYRSRTRHRPDRPGARPAGRRWRGAARPRRHRYRRAGVRAEGVLGAGWGQGSSLGDRRDRCRPFLRHRHPPRRGRPQQRSFAAVAPGCADTHRRNAVRRAHSRQRGRERNVATRPPPRHLAQAAR